MSKGNILRRKKEVVMRKWDSFYAAFLEVCIVILTLTLIIPGIVSVWVLFFKYAIPLI